MSLLTSVDEVLDYRGGRSPTGVEEVSASGEDAQAWELVGLIIGMSALGEDASSSMCGAPLELEACSGARGALKARKKQVTNEEREKQEMVMEDFCLPFSNRPRLLRAGHADFLPLGFVSGIRGLGLDSLIPADTCA
jgi:hypothetical protein